MAEYGDWADEISDIKGKVDRGEVVPDPDWQRGYIWRLKDEQLLIDSILNGMPIPKFYLTQEYDTRKKANIHYVVDGQQRIRAICKFLDNQFPIEINGKEYYFRDLDASRQQMITTYKFDGHYLRDFTQADINFLFQRLNRTGIKLTNMEEWNSEFYDTEVLGLIKEIEDEHRRFHADIIYTDENKKRMLPLDDILDMCNCLAKGVVEGGGKRILESFLTSHKHISASDASRIKSRFRKAILNLREILGKQELESSLYAKRTHFLSLLLAIGLLIDSYYVLADPDKLREALLDFIQDQPDQYKESVLGGIRHKVKRQTRVKLLQEIILRHSTQLDKNRAFPESLKQKLWRQYDCTCQLCGKRIGGYKYAVVDHIIPWAKAGPTEESNAQLAHRRCNQKKRDKVDQYVIL